MEISYYSDVLCIWAWVAQRRIDELVEQFGDTVQWRYRYVDVFGDSVGKMKRQWAERGLFEGFGQHVMDASSAFEYAPVNPDIWTRVRPATSANAHLVLKAVECNYSPGDSIALALALREAFFANAIDIGKLDSSLKVAAEHGFDELKVMESVNDGSAMAALMQDYQAAKEIGIKGSPSYVLDSSRQVLYGNVGYRILRANIEEVLNSPTGEASWC